MTFKTFKTCILDEWPLKPLKSHLGPLLTCFFDVLTCIFLISIFSVLCVMFFEVVIADHQSRVLTRPFQRIGPTRHKSHPTHWQASQYAADALPNTLRNSLQHPKNFRLLVKAKRYSSVYWKPLAASHDPPPAFSCWQPRKAASMSGPVRKTRQILLHPLQFPGQGILIYRVQVLPSSPANQKIYSQVKQW